VAPPRLGVWSVLVFSSLCVTLPGRGEADLLSLFKGAWGGRVGLERTVGYVEVVFETEVVFLVARTASHPVPSRPIPSHPVPFQAGPGTIS